MFVGATAGAITCGRFAVVLVLALDSSWPVWVAIGFDVGLAVSVIKPSGSQFVFCDVEDEVVEGSGLGEEVSIVSTGCVWVAVVPGFGLVWVVGGTC